MAIPVPRNWSTGEMGTAALLNTHIRDALEFFVTPPWCFVTSGSDQTISNNTNTNLTWTDQIVDSDNMMALGTQTDMVVATPGCYAIYAQIMFAVNATGTRWLTVDRVRSGVTTTLCRSSQAAADYTGGSSTSETAFQVGVHADLQIGDHVTFWCYQNSGGNLAAMKSTTEFRTWASVRWIGRL